MTPPSANLRTGKALAWLGMVTAIYLAVLIWADHRNQVFAPGQQFWRIMPLLMALTLVSFLLRYLRWRWLLRRGGGQAHRQRIPWLRGFAAYLSGFTFTATPGKVGELLRIRYFAPMGIPAERVLGAFVYERLFDLAAVMLLASLLALRHTGLFLLMLMFVAALAGTVVLAIRHPLWLRLPARRLHRAGMTRTARLLNLLRRGLQHCRAWRTIPDMLLSLAVGLLAWSTVALSFVLLLQAMDISMPPVPAMGVYPLAMLAGAASMLPGGIGSTEATIIVLLMQHGSSLETAALAAVGIRIATLWLSILCGLVSVLALECLPARGHANDVTTA